MSYRTGNQKQALYQELGAAYTQAKAYNLAIKAFEKALEQNPKDSQVHYNLGLLYQHYKNDTSKAVYHLKQCLKLNPKAKNKKEIEYLIEVLTR